MAPSLDPEVNPILRIYRLGRQGLEIRDGRHYLKFERGRLRDLAGAAGDLVGFLRARALTFDTCRLCLAGRPIVDFAAGPIESWFDWESIADLAREGLVDGEPARILGSMKRRLATYLDSGVWSAGRKPEDDGLGILEQLAAHDRDEKAFTLDVSLPKRGLTEDFLLTALPVPAEEISAFLWYDLESMCRAYGDFGEFLSDAGAERPIVVFCFQPLPAYSGDFFKVLPLDGPADSRPERERALADALGQFTPRVLSRYRDLRRRHLAEPRPHGRLDLPPTLLLDRGSAYPEHPLFTAGPWRSWMACALMSWLAVDDDVESRGGATTFVLPGGHRIALELGLDDVTWTGKSVFGDAGWSRRATRLARYTEHAAGSERLRGLWGRALAAVRYEDFVPADLWKTLDEARREFYEMLSLRDVTSESFVLLQADWPAAKSRELIERLEASHVIVSRAEPRAAFFLFTRRQALDGLGAGADPELATHRALGLEGTDPPPVLDGDVRAAAAPDFCVVAEEGRLLGLRVADLPEAGTWIARDRLRPAPAGGPEPPPAAGAGVVSRTLQADLPERISLDETATLRVSLSVDPDGLPMALPKGAAVDILVQPRQGLGLSGAGYGELVISEADSESLDFEIRATAAGDAEVAVMAFHQGQRLGALTLKPEATSGPVPSPQAVSSSRRLQPVASAQPDLTLTIFEHRSDGRPAFTLRLTARESKHGLNLTPFGPVELRFDPLKYFAQFFAGIGKLSCETSEDKVKAREYLEARGDFLFGDLVPPELQSRLWALRDQIHTVRVQSEEPWIPWELLKLHGRSGNGKIEKGPFLCEAFAMTRWLVGLGLQPTMSLRKIALVVPADSRLPSAARERDYLLSLREDREVDEVPANSLDLRHALASGTYDGWHFTGHGVFRPYPDRSVIVLEDGDELTPEDLSGVVRNLGEAKPLVFLNACQIGRSALSLTGIGGWAPRFLEAGAAAFVGAYWNIWDETAGRFAEALYSRLLRGVPIGQAAQEARLEIRLMDDPTWLAYTVFADPSAVVA